MSNESLLVILLVGLVAGWLAGQIMQGGGFGILGDLVIGILGAFIGDWLLPQVGLHLGSGIVPAIIDATIGALNTALPSPAAFGRRPLGRRMAAAVGPEPQAGPARIC